MSSTMPRLLLMLSVSLAGCASLKPPADEHPSPPSAANPIASKTVLDLECHEPAYLVRDLTVRWGAHRYVIGPCDGDLMGRGETPATGMLPAAPSGH